MSNRTQHTLNNWICVALTVGTLAVYWQVADFEFTNFDDISHVAGNPNVQRGLTLPGVVWAFTTGQFSNWHPLTWLSHMLDCEVFGLNAGMHHLVNAAFHLANALLLFFLLRRMTGALWRSAFVAALFALHPLHVESVAWVSERKDTLSMLFGLLALWAYSRYVGESKVQSPKSRAFYILSLTLFALGLMSKPMLVTWPFVLLLLDYWPLQRISTFNFRVVGSRSSRVESADSADEVGRVTPCAPGLAESQDGAHGVTRPTLKLRHLLLEKLPFLALAVASSAITFVVQKRGGAMDATEGLSFADRVANALVAYVRYLGKTFWPVDLAVPYPHPGHWPPWQVVVAVIILLSLSLAVITQLRRRPWLAVGWFWFMGTLVPVIGLVQVGSQAMADRYTYIPHIGLFVAIVWMANELTKSWPFRRVIAFGASAVVIIGCLMAARAQTGYWKNSVSLFSRALAVTSNNVLAHYNCGQALAACGQASEAMWHYREALRISPDHFPAHLNLGGMCYESRNWSEATNHLMQAVQLRPGHSLAHYNLALSLAAVGDWTAAETNFAAAALGNTNDFELQIEWGKTLLTQKKFEAAGERLAEGLRLNPASAVAHTELGMALEARQKTVEAAAHFAEALRLQPDLPETLNNLAWRLATDSDAGIRDGREAVWCALRACELTQHQQAVLIGTLAAAYAEAGQFEEAQKAAAKAITLAEASGQQELAARNRQLLELYQAQKAYRETR